MPREIWTDVTDESLRQLIVAARQGSNQYYNQWITQYPQYPPPIREEPQVQVCRNCHTEHPDGEMKNFGWHGAFQNPEYVCDACIISMNLIICEDCGRATSPQYAMWTPHGDRVCDRCFYDNYRICYGCDTTIDIDDAINIYIAEEGDDAPHCAACAGEIQRVLIKRYHQVRKDTQFFGLEGDTTDTFIGIELEVEAPGNSSWDEMNKDAEVIQSLFPEGFLFFETDSSINYGFEIVTAPMTYSYFKSQRKAFITMLNILTEKGYKSHNTDTCGLHVHVGYAAFGEVQSEVEYNITKLLLFVERNFDELELIARRSRASCERWCDKYDTKDKRRIDSIVKQEKHMQQKYRAINLANMNTAEFRIFRGTLLPSTFFSTVDLVLGLVDVSKQYGLREIESIDGFCNLFSGTKWEATLMQFLSGFKKEEK